MLLLDSGDVPYCSALRAEPGEIAIVEEHREGHSSVMTRLELLRTVERISQFLQQHTAPRERVLIVVSSSLEGAAALLACLHANIAAVPVVVPDSAPLVDLGASIEAIADDCHVAAVLGGQRFEDVAQESATLRRLTFFNLRQLRSEPAQALPAARRRLLSDPALVLYTSGSSNAPKGIVFDHASLLNQCQNSAQQWNVTSTSRIVSWCPLFHSLGIRFNLLVPLLMGARTVLLPPARTAASPYHWLDAITRHRATHSAAPNFAFEQCVRRISDDQLESLNLSSLEGIFNGGETVRAATCARFSERFAHVGLAPSATRSHYGLSETGSVSATAPGSSVAFLRLEAPALDAGCVRLVPPDHAHRLIASSGRVGANVTVRTVVPGSRRPCCEDEVGEIWVRTDAAGSAYLHRSDLSAETFGCAISDGDGGYVRTGDLGFCRDGELYVVGREKDVLIVRGKNHDPADIEWTIQDTVAEHIRSAVVVTDPDDCPAGDARLVAVIELSEDAGGIDRDSLARRIVAAVSSSHGLRVDEVALVSSGSLPRTASGKLQRRLARTAFSAGRLQVQHSWRLPTGMAPVALDVRSDCEIRRAVVRIVAAALDTAPDSVEGAGAFCELGIDSLGAARIAADVAATFGFDCSVVDLFGQHTLAHLVAHVSSHTTKTHH